jgi:homotetrameric cytidine deaminase
MDSEPLLDIARTARQHAYAPYSRFEVGAALLTVSGRVFTGCNVENLSFGLTICAERAAVCAAIAAGEREFVRIAVVADSVTPVSPCGACRQVLVEFGSDVEMVSSTLAGETYRALVSELLPRAREGILERKLFPRRTVFVYPKRYDVIVIGAGHAGIEAASAAARLGCETLLLTQNADSVGQMSCNPAIGGQAKGQMVREIDALGGVMGLNTDATGIQFRMLNAAKGPSVRSPRAQCDKKAYQFRAKAVLERTDRLDLKQANVTGLLVQDDSARGVECDFGLQFHAAAVVVTTGTFMRGLLHIGLHNKGRRPNGGRCVHDQRFATGTRVRSRTIQNRHTVSASWSDNRFLEM